MITIMHLPVFSTVKPEVMFEDEWVFEHERVCGYIRHFVNNNVYNHICNKTHARTLWNKLEQLYVAKTGNNKLFYLTQLMEVKYQENTSVADHLNNIEGMVDQLSTMGIKFDDEIIV
ncbi:MAG: hypothetical protein Q8830_03320, partial [Candidatus Phytoplasma australasiaticum]|nr:hypothetical protein [Candidatus Phytoplasma australasiaticum]